MDASIGVQFTCGRRLPQDQLFLQLVFGQGHLVTDSGFEHFLSTGSAFEHLILEHLVFEHLGFEHLVWDHLAWDRLVLEHLV